MLPAEERKRVAEAVTGHSLGESMDTTTYLLNAIEHAPPLDKCPERHPMLRGWWVGDDIYICADCASRVMERGCSLDQIDDASPVWRDRNQAYGMCVTCRDF